MDPDADVSAPGAGAGAGPDERAEGAGAGAGPDVRAADADTAAAADVRAAAAASGPDGGEYRGGPDVDSRAVRAVREAGDRLATVEGTPAAAHVATYDEVHAVLQDALADLDEH